MLSSHWQEKTGRACAHLSLHLLERFLGHNHRLPCACHNHKHNTCVTLQSQLRKRIEPLEAGKHFVDEQGKALLNASAEKIKELEALKAEKLKKFDEEVANHRRGLAAALQEPIDHLKKTEKVL